MRKLARSQLGYGRGDLTLLQSQTLIDRSNASSRRIKTITTHISKSNELQHSANASVATQHYRVHTAQLSADFFVITIDRLNGCIIAVKIAFKIFAIVELYSLHFFLFFLPHLYCQLLM